MAETDDPADKPDLTQGVASAAVREGELLSGRVGDTPVLLTRIDGAVMAYGSTCPHLRAPLEKGLCAQGVLRCPWHHARFDLRTGEAVAAPAFGALPRWRVDMEGDRIAVREPVAAPSLPIRSFEGHSEPGIVIVGAGAAAYAAAHALRRRGYEGPVTMVSDDPDPSYDRTLLSKDYLDGAFGDDRLPIAGQNLGDLGVARWRARAEALDPAARHLRLSDGRTLVYTKLLLATGAEPNRLDVPGADLPHVHRLRSLADCRAILAGLAPGARVVVIGSSFIGLEAAASIRSRGFDVTVVTPETAPMARILGEALSQAVVAKHRSEGVRVLIDTEVRTVEAAAVILADGTSVAADLVVVGIGVTPRLDLARAAGLCVEDGVMVDLTLQTSDPNIYAAGDIARWPDVRSDGPIRVEHWVVAERQGQVAAANMLGGELPYTEVPFFWSKHFDLSFRCVGHAESWDEIAVDGDLAAGKAVLHYRTDGRELAVATVGDDLAALRAELRMEAEPRAGDQNRRATPV